MTFDFVMPQLGETVAEGTITTWFAAVGDEVTAAEALCEVATDKIDSELHPPIDGVLTEILVHPGETVDVGVVLARIQGEDAEILAPAAPEGDAASAADVATPEAVPTAAPNEVQERPRQSPLGVGRLSPVVRRLSIENDVDLEQVVGTGAAGRITKSDILEHIDQRAAGVLLSPGADISLRVTPIVTGGAQMTMVAVDVDYAAIDLVRTQDIARMAFVVFATCRANRQHQVVGGLAEPGVDLDGQVIDGASGWRLPRLATMVSEASTIAGSTAGSAISLHDFSDAASHLNIPSRAASTRVALAVQPVSSQLRVEQSAVGYSTTVSPRGTLIANYDGRLLDHQTVSTWLTTVGQILERHNWSAEL